MVWLHIFSQSRVARARGIARLGGWNDAAQIVGRQTGRPEAGRLSCAATEPTFQAWRGWVARHFPSRQRRRVSCDGRGGGNSGMFSPAFVPNAQLPCRWWSEPHGCPTRFLGSAFGGATDLSYGSMTRWKSRRPSNACCTNGRMLWRGTFRLIGWPSCRGSILQSSTGPAMTRLGGVPIRGFGGLTAIVEAAQNVIDKGF